MEGLRQNTAPAAGTRVVDAGLSAQPHARVNYWTVIGLLVAIGAWWLLLA